MIKKITRLSVLSATVAATSCLGMSSIVSADSITLTGPDSYNVISSNTGSSNGYSGNINSNTWNTMNPATWQTEGRSFSTWWSDMTNQMSQYRTACWMSQNYARDSSWTPSGSDWQASWSNWNPFTWESHGQSYANWRSQVMSYLDQNYGTMMKQWITSTGTSNNGAMGNGVNTVNPSHNNQSAVATPYSQSGDNRNGSSYQSSNNNNVEVNNTNNQTATTGNASSNFNTIGGNVTTGNANNENDAQTSVNLANSTPSYDAPASYQNNGSNGGGSVIGDTGPDSHNSVSGSNGGYGSIGDTGPGSYNSISNGYDGRSDYSSTNSNTVTSNTSNSQYASTGNATSNGNTFGGNVSSGSSSNGNGSYGSYDARNN
jgi:hypothetical protein